VGKSTLLNQLYPPQENYWVDLLDSSVHREYFNYPERLRQNLQEYFGPEHRMPLGFERKQEVRQEPRQQQLQENTQIVIDEIQSAPQLLSEIHLMIETMGYKFALCGSSNRKLVGGRYNLLGGRAKSYKLHGLTSHELDDNFDLEKIINSGYFLASYLSENPKSFLSAYVGEYLINEIISESAVRKLDSFQGFLESAAIRDGSKINYTSIAKECNVDVKTVQRYYAILSDTLFGYWLPPYTRTANGRKPASDKFYFADVGVVNFLAKRGQLIESRSVDFSQAFENWVFHEVLTFLQYNYHDTWDYRLSYWQDRSSEVNFLIGNQIAIDVQSTDNVIDRHLRSLQKLAHKHPSFVTLIVVCRAQRSRQTADGIRILSYKDFTKNLWNGEFLAVVS